MLVSGALAGLILGLAIGREWRRIARLQVTWFPLLVAALTARAAAPLVPPIALPLYLAAIGGTSAVAAANWRLPGAVLIALGSVLNLVVVGLNGAMPVDAAGLSTVGRRMPGDLLHESISSATVLPFLADVVIIAPLQAAYSVGDIAIAVGAFLLSFLSLARR